MATAEDIQAVRDRIEDKRVELTLERDRATSAARGSETDATLALLLAEEERLEAQIDGARADADHQERAVGLLPAVAETTEDAPAPGGPVPLQLAFSGRVDDQAANTGDDVTGRA